MLFLFIYLFIIIIIYFCQTTSKSVTVNHIQSFSINIPHTEMCKFIFLKWIYGIHKKCSSSAFQYSNCHPNCCHSLQQVRLTECSIILTTLLRILFVNNDTRTFHSDGTDMFIDKYLLLRDELKILSKLQAFAQNTLCGAVCTNCFEKCTYFFANITVRMIREMHQSDWEKLFSGLKQWIQRDVKEEVKDTTEEEEEEEEREYREEEEKEKDEEERMRQHGRGRSRARRQTVSYILVDACQGWIRHARGFYPRCLARDNIACDVEDVLWPDPDQRRDAGAE